jgi:tetratricopeptide (TPR) repeat protein
MAGVIDVFGRFCTVVSYRNILLIVTVLSFLIAGLSEIRTSLFLTILLMNLCMWSWPIVAKWKKQRNAQYAAGEKHLQVGNYAEAEQKLAVALAEAQSRNRPPLKRAEILRNLAEAQRRQRKFPPAEQSIRQAMALVADLKGQGREEYGQCLELLGCLFEDSGNYPQTQQILQESLSVEEGLPKPNAERLAKLRQKLALAFHRSGDHSAASPHFVRALELHEQAFGAEHAETGKMLTELGTAQQREGNHAEALRNLERALRIQEKALGADSPEVTHSLYHLALAYEKSGNLEQAAAQFEHMLQLRQRQARANELETAAALAHLSRLCFKLGRLARAEEAALASILILERKQGSELGATLETLARIYERMGRSQEAASTHERAREARSRTASINSEALPGKNLR